MITIPVNSWSNFKTIVIETKKLDIQCAESVDRYELFASEAGIFVWNICLLKDAGEDVTDFETNYKSSVNLPSKLNVVQQLGRDALTMSPVGTHFVATHGQTTVNDFELDATKVIKGGKLAVKNAAWGDYIKVSVIDKNNVLGYGGTPEEPLYLSTYVKKWYVMPDQLNQLEDVSISQLLPEGLFVRTEYVSVGDVDLEVVLNLISYELS